MPIENLKVVVTGGAGFIGSAVVRHLICNTGHFVVNVDKLTYAGNIDSVSSVMKNHRYAFERVDICNTEDVKKVFTEYQPDLVMHLAAESHVDRSIDGPAEFIQTNIVGSYVMLEQARLYWLQLKSDKKANFRFHHISTDEVYGDLRHRDDLTEPETSTLPLFTEESAYSPNSPYSASKAASDHLVRSWNRTYGLPIIVTNCSNNYGPYQFPEKLIPLVILNALEGKPLPIYGKGNQIRDWLYVEDHAAALILAATKAGVGQTYNIGGHNEKQNIDVVKSICRILDELVPVSENPCIQNSRLNISQYENLIAFVDDRPGHDMRYAIDASKIKHDLGWVPEETFESGLRKTVQWYLDNQKWCQRVQDGSYQRERLGKCESSE